LGTPADFDRYLAEHNIPEEEWSDLPKGGRRPLGFTHEVLGLGSVDRTGIEERPAGRAARVERPPRPTSA
jgi:hypothetical protein